MILSNRISVKERLQNILGVKIEQNMATYDLYDDSIKMFKILGKINNGFKIEMGMIDLAVCDTVDTLIEKIEDKLNKRVATVGEISLSPLQQSYWIGREQDFYGTSNSTHLYLEVRHEMDINKIEKSIRELIRRHAALRSIIRDEKQMIFDEKIADSFYIKSINITEQDKDIFFQECRYNSQVEIRDLDNWPLFDVKNICVGAHENILVIDIEMIIVDGMSLQILLKEFWAICSEGRLDEQKIDYLEYVEAIQKTKDETKYESDKKYWKQRLALIPDAPKLPECNSFAGKNIYSRLQKKIDKEQWDALELLAKRSGVTVSIVFLYAYLKTLGRWSEEAQFTVNVTMANRPYEVNNAEKVVGDFTTNILFDFKSSELGGTITEQLKFIRNRLYEYCDHSNYEGIEIIRDMIRAGQIGHDKTFPIVFTSMIFGRIPNLSEIEVIYSQSQTSQVSLDNQTYRFDNGGLIVWDYLKKIYPDSVMEEMFSYYCLLINQLSKNDGQIICFPAFEERVKYYNATEKLIKHFNIDNHMDYIFEKFAEKIAIVDACGNITYRELEIGIKSTMHDLQCKGVKSGKYIVIKTDKSKESVITILALVLAGATYVPVESNWPIDRIQYILENVGADMIIDPYEVCSFNKNVRCSWENIDLESSIYVIYTSGSTGRPKGVEISYKGMLNTVLDINDRIELNSDNTILGLSSLCFDLSVYDLFASIFTGATLKLVKELRDTENIKNIVDSSSNIIWNSVPAAMELFIDSLDTDYVNCEMKYVLLSGDWINLDLPDKVKKHFPEATVFSLGGATEASIWSIYYQIDKINLDWNSIPYGYPLTNQSIYILNSEHKICPPEVIGEIYIGGIGVAKGYVNDAEKTDSSFVNSQYGRLYRTGDFGKFSKEGYVLFCGRRDSQVKIGGYRIELGEIETNIKNISAIRDCVAVINSKKQIVVYYKGDILDEAIIKRGIRQTLPTYMYPHKYYRVDDFPLNSNGKIDRKMLKTMADTTTEGRVYNKRKDGLINSLLESIIEIWTDVLNCEVKPENDFFELGGDSIKAQRIVRKINDIFNVKISFLTVINSKDVIDFCREIERICNTLQNSNKKETTPDIQKEEDGVFLPLTGVQLAYLNGRNDNFELGKYNAHYYFEVETQYTAEQIEVAINKVILRHDALRTIFYKNGKQKIMNEVPNYSILVIKCQNESEKEQEVKRYRKMLSHKIYNHEQWPLFTFQMMESPISKILMVSLDLMVCDGDSMQILFTELANVLEGKAAGKKIEYSYSEYLYDISKANNQEIYNADKDYWLDKLPLLSSYPKIPMKMNLTECKEYSVVRKSAIIDKNVWNNFKEEARKHRISPSSLLCTLYGRILAKWGNQREILLNLTVFQRHLNYKDVDKIIGDFTKLLPLNLSFDKKDIWGLAVEVQEQIMKDLEHLSYDGTEIMRELAKRQGTFGKALLPVVFTCVLFDNTENYFERLGNIKYAVSQTPQVFLDNQITEMSGELHVSWDVIEELFDTNVIDEIFLEFVTDVKKIGTSDIANSTDDFVEKIWQNFISDKIYFDGDIPDIVKDIDLTQARILDYSLELCPPEVEGRVYICDNAFDETSNTNNWAFIQHPRYGKMLDTELRGILRNNGYMEFMPLIKETNVLNKKEEAGILKKEGINSSSLKKLLQIWKEIFEKEDISGSDDFYTLGGDSITLMRLVDEICVRLKCDVTIDDILQSENISELADKIGI